MLMIVMGWTYFDLGLTRESTLLKWQSFLKRRGIGVSRVSPLYALDTLVLVDVSADKTVVFDSSELKRQVITDPRLLDTVLREFDSAGTYRYILCDVYFPVATDYDSTLLKTIYSTRNIAFPLSEGYSTQKGLRPLEALPGGVVHYQHTNDWHILSDQLIKFQLVNGHSEKSLPLYMAEEVTGRTLTSATTVNNITFNAYLRPADLRRPNAPARLYSLSDLHQFMFYQTPAERREWLKTKFILIGNFTEDVYKTAFGDMPGVLILFNIYLSILDGAHEFSWSWLVFLLAAFSGLSWLTFYWKGEKRFRWVKDAKTLLENLVGDIGLALFINFVALFFIALFSVVLFNKTTPIAILTFYMVMIDYCKYLVRNYPHIRPHSKKKVWTIVKYLFKIKPQEG